MSVTARMRARLPEQDRVAGAAPVLLVALPFLVLVLRECLRRTDYSYAGDQALIELDVRRIVHGDQFLGAYSRFGWRHPGPSWYTLLTGPYRLLGGHSWSLAAAVVLLNGLAAIGIVAVVQKLGGRVVAVVAGLLVLLLARQLHPGLFSLPWNPVAVVVPALLFLLLAVAWLLGRRTAAGWTLILGSVLVQTHIGTGVLVGAVVVVVAAVRLGITGREWRRRPRFDLKALDWARLRVPAAFAVLLGLVWLGPVVQQLSSTPGNIRQLSRFASDNSARLGWRTAAGYLSDPLQALLGRTVPLGSVLPPAGAGVAAALGAAGLVLMVLGGLTRSRNAAAVAGMFLVAEVAAVQTVRQNVGPVYGYLVLWMSVLPILLLLGYGFLAGDLLGRLASRRPSIPIPIGIRIAVAVAVSVAGLAVVLSAPSSSLSRATPAAGSQRLLDQLAVAAVGKERGPVLVRDDNERRWPQASGIVLALRRLGVDAQVPPGAAVLFSPPYVTSRPAPVTLQLVPVTGNAPLPGPGDAGCLLRGGPATCLRVIR